MKLLLVHSHRFLIDDEAGVYADGKFDQSILARYLRVFSEVVVAGRSGKARRTDGLSRIDSRRIKFLPLEDVRSRVEIGRARTLRRQLEEALPDVDAVIARVPSVHGEIAIEAALAQGKAFGVEVVGNPLASLWHHGRLEGRLLAPFAFLRMRALVRRAPAALYVTRSYLQRLFPSPGFTVSCSNVEVVVPSGELVARRLEAYPAGGSVTLGMIGTLQAKYKGIGVALKALQEVRRQGLDAELQVIGEGDPLPWVRIAERLGVASWCRFLGVKSRQDVLDWLDRVDIYLHPSFTEGLPRAMLEAMSRGCPVLGSAVGGIPEVIHSRSLHKPRDWRTLAVQVQGVLRSRQEWADAVMRSVEGLEGFDSDTLNGRRVAFYRAVLEQ